jgi:hypothetical protein
LKFQQILKEAVILEDPSQPKDLLVQFNQEILLILLLNPIMDPIRDPIRNHHFHLVAVTLSDMMDLKILTLKFLCISKASKK